MAVLNFPVPYPEELLYSTVARAGVRQGLSSPKQLLDDVFGSRSIIATIDLPNHLATISLLLPHEFTPEKLIYSHTLLPLYIPFVPEVRRIQCMKWLLAGSQGAVHLTLGIAASRIKIPRYIRYCPSCLSTQREQQGEYFWLREWQVSGIDACQEHGVLIDTRIARPLTERHRFIAAAPEHCPLVSQRRGMEVSDWISVHVRQLLTLPPQVSPGFVQWTAYYRRLAQQLGFSRGMAQIDHQSIRDLVLQEWPVTWLTRNSLMPNGTGGDESDWLRSIFRKHRKSFNYLQHIVVHQALLGENWQIGEVLKEVSRCPLRDNSQQAQVVTQNTTDLTPDQKNWLGILQSHPPKQARAASPALYAKLYRSYREWLLEANRDHADIKTSVCIQRVDWDKRDRECLQALRQLVIFLKSNQQGPRRSRTYYLKLLGNFSTIEKNLCQMPRSTAFLSAHTENVEQYQIRRLQNSYDDLRSLFYSPPRWRLLRNATLSEERLTEQAKIFLDNLVNPEHEIQRCRR